MPEHHEGTPEELRDLESFLWWDFDTLDLWRTWTVKRGWNAGGASQEDARYQDALSVTCYEDALSVQAALRALQAANNGMAITGDPVERLNRAIEDHALRPQISVDGDLAVIPSRADDPVGHILSLAALAMTRGLWKRFKVCRDAGCRASYFDATRNGGKTWCAMETCGSRNKMRRLRAKRG